MMDAFLERGRREVYRVLQLVAEPRMGRVTSFDPATHSIKAQVLPEADFPLQPGDVAETGSIPMGPVAGGNGWGIYAPPMPGTQVMLTHSEHKAGAPVAVTTINDQANVPPGAQAGEIWLVHSSTLTWIKLTNDKNAAITVNGTLAITTTTGDFDISISGTLNASASTVNITSTVAANIIAPQVNLGGMGGPAVARIGDHVSTGGTISSGSGIVFSG